MVEAQRQPRSLTCARARRSTGRSGDDSRAAAPPVARHGGRSGSRSASRQRTSRQIRPAGCRASTASRQRRISSSVIAAAPSCAVTGGTARPTSALTGQLHRHLARHSGLDKHVKRPIGPSRYGIVSLSGRCLTGGRAACRSPVLWRVNMMILITGGAGFIGSCLLAGLEAAGQQDLVVCDRLGRDDKWRNIAKRALVDIVPPPELFDWLGAAGRAPRRCSISARCRRPSRPTPTTDRHSNFRLTMRLWDWCAEKQVRLVYASSAATYGDGAAGLPTTTRRGPDPVAAAERLWLEQASDRSPDRSAGGAVDAPPQWAGLKFFNVYGPNEYHKGGQRSLVPQLHRADCRDRRSRLFRSYRPEYRRWRPAARLRMGRRRASGRCSGCSTSPEVSGLFNVGSGQASTSTTWHAPCSLPWPARAGNRLCRHAGNAYVVGYQYYTGATLDRLRAAGCPFQPTPLEEGVRRYVQDYLDGPDPYR